MAPKTSPRTIAKFFAGKTFRTPARLAAVVAAAGLASACGGSNYAAKEDAAPRSGPQKKYSPDDQTVFGSGGLSVGTLNSANTGILGGGGDEKARLPVNKYLWQGALDTLSFLPLSSSDPFTGVIATEWGSTPEAPGERLKVTAYILNPGLTAAALKVAVYREVRSDTGLWAPAPVSAETGRRIEDAILARARQIRIAEREGTATG
ncbi:MAG: DUF3576 domain-containing protein [Alphaproteobacteria bacterium]